MTTSAPAASERGEGQDGGGRVAAGIRDQAGPANFGSVDFRQSVHRLGQVGQIAMACAIPLGVDVGIAQAVVGAKVNDAAAALE